MINVSNNSHPTHAHLTIQRTGIHKNWDMRIKTKEILCARIAERIPEWIAECVGIIMALCWIEWVNQIGFFRIPEKPPCPGATREASRRPASAGGNYPSQGYGGSSPYISIVRNLPIQNDEEPLKVNYQQQPLNKSRTISGISDTRDATGTPCFLSRAIFDRASPSPPSTIAPACPIRLSGGADMPAI